MSGDAVAQVWYRCDELTPAQIVVLCAVADVVNDAHGNEFWMSSTALAEKVCMNAGNVRHRLLELVEAGWIEVLGKQAKGVVRYRWLGRVETTRVDSTRVQVTRVEKTRNPRRQHAAPASTARTPSSLRTKSNSTELNVEGEPTRLAALLAALIKDHDPNAKTPTDLTAWAKDIEKLIRLDKRPPAEVERIIRWCQGDNFWRGNILSASKLRKQFTALVIKAKPVSNGNGRQTGNTRESFTSAALEFLETSQ